MRKLIVQQWVTVDNIGANTYAQSKGYWPYADDQGEYCEKLSNLTKFVLVEAG